MSWWRDGKRSDDHAFQPSSRRDPESEMPPKMDPRRALPRSEGEPLAKDERTSLESAFGQDLSEVRIHRDDEAAKLAATAGADACTVGRDVYFARGAYGAGPLAHEVTHVIQQTGATSVSLGEDAFLERQAEDASSAILSGRTADISSAASAPAMQRQAAPGSSTSALNRSRSLTLDHFDIDEFVLSGSQKQKLDEFAEQLKGTLASPPGSIVDIVGFADHPGTEAHNLALGQQRAERVRGYLTEKGLSASQLHATSLGDASPAIPSKGYEAKNRRVEVNVIEPDQPSPQPSLPASAPKKIDLTYHPDVPEPTPSEALQERLREVDKAVRESQALQTARRGTSVADASGQLLRSVARKLGLPKSVQELAESLGRDLPSKGAQAIISRIAADTSMDANTQNALKAVVDALARTKVR